MFTANHATLIIQILDCMLRRLNHDLTVQEIQEVADAAHGYVGADLAALCKEGMINIAFFCWKLTCTC
jgi:SpoVK/Ycf46/Vps4 family AAA+-type ATPase